jgi:formate dehydrogenase major subunit
MYRGSVKGMLAFGMNGVAIGPNSQKNIDALKKADWLVVGEIYPDETSEFWKSPGHHAEEMKTIKTDGLSPALRRLRRERRTLTNSARWLQWKNAPCRRRASAARSGHLARIFLKVRELYRKRAASSRSDSESDLELHRSAASVALAEVAKEINGKALADVTDPKTQVTIKAASNCRASPG